MDYTHWYVLPKSCPVPANWLLQYFHFELADYCRQQNASREISQHLQGARTRNHPTRWKQRVQSFSSACKHPLSPSCSPEELHHAWAHESSVFSPKSQLLNLNKSYLSSLGAPAIRICGSCRLVHGENFCERAIKLAQGGVFSRQAQSWSHIQADKHRKLISVWFTWRADSPSSLLLVTVRKCLVGYSEMH